MNWYDLILELNQIPVHRRNEKAVFMLRNEDMEPEEGWTIDSKEEVKVVDLTADSDIGDGETTFVIAG